MKNAHVWSELLECRRTNQRNHQLTNTAITRESQVHESRPWFDGLPPITEPSLQAPSEDFYAERCVDELPSENESSIEHPPRSCAISADVRTFDFLTLSKIVPNFDAIIIDPPWDVGRSGFGPTAQGRVRFRRNTVNAQNSCNSPQYALNYHQLRDSEIESIPMEAIQKDGLIFMWIVNNRLQKGINIMCRRWKYRFVTIIDWIKTHRSTSELAAGNGHFLRHGKECVLVGLKLSGLGKSMLSDFSIDNDLFHAPRGAISQKPSILHEIIEEIYRKAAIKNGTPGEPGKFLEIFGRTNNLRNGWVTMGDEL